MEGRGKGEEGEGEGKGEGGTCSKVLGGIDAPGYNNPAAMRFLADSTNKAATWRMAVI